MHQSQLDISNSGTKWAIFAAGPIITLGTGLLIEEIRRNEGIYRDTHPQAADRLYVLGVLIEILGLNQYPLIGNEFIDLIKKCALKLFGERLTFTYFDPNLNSILEKTLSNLGITYTRPPWMNSL